MSASIKARKVKIISDDEKKELTHYFNQMVGTETPDANIIGPKYDALISHVVTVRDVTDAFAVVIKQHEEYVEYGPDFDQFVARLEVFLTANKPGALEPSAWAGIKNSDVICELLVICQGLLEISGPLGRAWADVDKDFMNRCTPPTFTPLPFTKLNLRYLWDVGGGANDHAANKMRELIFFFMSAVYLACYEIYKITTSPDVDVRKLSEVIIGSIAALRKQIPRCEKAFKKIEESVGLLETNFDDYYKDFIQSKDPTNIFTAFVTDVSQSTENDAQLIFQCRHIVNFFRQSAEKRMAEGKTTPEQQSIFNTLIAHYNKIDAHTGRSSADADTPAVETPVAGRAKLTPEPAPTNDDDRDLDDLIRQIENPRTMSIATKSKKK